MRYNAEYKEQARDKLLTESGRHAKENGFLSSGLADLSAAAGVTTGSLYKHFTGKSDLFVSIIQKELKRTADMYGSVDATDPVQVSRSLSGYLSLSHVRNAGSGCPLPSLTPEIGRSSDEIKSVFEEGVQAIHANVKALTGDSSSAWAVMAQNVGAVMIARAMQNESLQKEILKAVRQAGEKILASDSANPPSRRS
jgi:TetR/AcrR family transcriptional regulator, transcriptional repressor for nem operon